MSSERTNSSRRMRNFMQLIQGLFRTVVAIFGRVYAWVVDFIAVKSKGPHFKAVLMVVGLCYIHLVGIIDLRTVRGMNFEFFYLLGCALVGWGVGAWPAMLLVLISGAFLLWDETNRHVPLPLWVMCWNTIVRLLAFAATAPGFFSTGKVSPVRTAWLTKKSFASSTIPSAGIRLPAESATTSPGTTCSEGNNFGLPPRSMLDFMVT